MWKLYLNSDEGIAIRSTRSLLAKSLPACAEYDFYIAPVRYVDFSADDGSNWNPTMTQYLKRKSFEHERELRVLVSKAIGHLNRGVDYMRFDQQGVDIRIDVATLIKSVHISPLRATWFKSLVEAIVKRYGYNFPVQQSDLGIEPEW